MKTYFSGLAALALALLLSCGEDKAVVDHTYDGLKKVSVSDAQVFNGDLAKIPGGDKVLLANTRRSAGAAKAAPLALIPFKEVRVMVLWHDYYSGLEYNECQEYQRVAAAFGGRKLNKWDQIVAGCRMMPETEIVYAGTLTKSDTFVTGDIYVKAGINVVNIGYIDAGDTMTWVSDAHYINFEGLGVDLPYWYTDGWADMGMGEIWSSRRHSGWYNSAYDYYEYEFIGTNYLLPYIGLNKAYADYHCTMIP
jgi:hypothetical protein